jgi:hypothetical protein
MIVDGGRTEEAVLNMGAVTLSTSTRRVGHVMHASHTAVWQVSISSSFTRIIGKKFRQWAQRTTPGDRSVVSGFSNAVPQSLGFPASCSTPMRRPFLERVFSTAITTMFRQMKIRTQHSNKATSKDFPSVTGVVLFMIF